MATRSRIATLLLLIALAALAARGVAAPLPCTTENGFPGGSYRQSCQSCQFDAAKPNRFGASCNDRSGHPKQSWIEDVTACAADSTDNLDGTLFCRPEPTALPTGSYQQTCANCWLDNGELKCRCSPAAATSPRRPSAPATQCAPAEMSGTNAAP
ncbi:MAG: CVNH domain-containing protein [Dongiaceae bacterium]